MSVFDTLSDRVEGFFDEVFIPEPLRRKLQQASQLLEEGQVDQALRLVEACRDEYDDHHRIYHLLGVAKLESGDPEAALEDLERALDLRDEALTRFYAGRAAEAAGADYDARLHYQSALQESADLPFEGELYAGLGRIFLRSGRPDRAAHALEKARQTGIDTTEVAVTLARARLEQDAVERAREALDSLDAEARGVEARLVAGRIDRRRGRHARAAEHFEAVLEARPENVEAMLEVGEAHLEAGSPARANQYALRALDSTEDSRELARAHLLAGRSASKAGDWRRAVEAFEDAVDRAESAEAADLGLRAVQGAGRARLELGDVDEATDHFEHLVDAHDDEVRVRALLGLAECRLASGDAAAARRLLRASMADGAAPDAEYHHLAGRAALEDGDPAEAVVSLQEALHEVDSPARRAAIEDDRERALGKLEPDWQLPDQIDGPVDAERVVDELEGFLADKPIFEPLLGETRRLGERLRAPVSVAIVGEFNAGKSTLVNALVGEPIVPTGVLPTTAHTCFIRYGPRRTARIFYASGDGSGDAPEVEEVTFEEARSRMEAQPEAIDYLEFRYPHPQLRSIHFWDTPGFNAADGAHEETAHEAIREAEAVLWVLDANQALSRTEFDLIDTIDDSDQRAVVLLNKADRLNSSSEVDELVDYVDEHLAGRAVGTFAISALGSLQHRADAAGGEDEVETPHLPAFEAFRDLLDQKLVQRAGRLKTLDARRRLPDLLDAVEERRDALLANYEWALRELQAAVEEFDETWRELPETRAERESSRLADQFGFAVTAAARDILDDLRPSGTIFTTPSLDDDDRAFVLELLERRLEDVLERSRERVAADLSRHQSDLTERLTELFGGLDADDARSLQRRIDGLYDELRVLHLLLDERVYGQLRAQVEGTLELAGPDRLDELEGAGTDELEAWSDGLSDLVPDPEDHVDAHLTGWYRECFDALHRLCARVRRDLQLLRLETEARYDITPLRELFRPS